MEYPKYDYSKLRGRIREKYSTEGNFAEAMRMSKATISAKLSQKSDFLQSEIMLASELLGIPRPEVIDYFFSHKV